MEKRKNMVVVVGSSRLGALIASKNSSEGIYTMIIDKDEFAFNKLESDYSGFTMVGDATELSVLKKAHMDQASELDIITEDDDTNIFIACMALHYFDVSSIIVRLQENKKAVLIDDPRVKVIVPADLSMSLYENLKTAEVGK